MKKKTWLIALAGALAFVGIGAGVVMAQTPGSGTPGAGTSFLDRVAQKLGIDTPKLQEAVTGARNDQIDEAVKNGDLTQKQADSIKSHTQDKLNGSDFGFGFDGPGKHGFGPGVHGGFGPGLEDGGQKLADFLGISTDQLKSELAATDATLATVANAHGKDRDTLKSFITGNLKSSLDAKVQSGDLTQKQEDAMVSVLNSHLDSLVDSKFGGGRGYGFKFGPGGPHPGAPAAGDTPSAPTQGGGFNSRFQS